uniref:Heavy metal translocating P-type ATPase n=1 Tax=Eiseniibacteriota bacterium TaxID=2212470 RepID=A0A832I250_UNCEI
MSVADTAAAPARGAAAARALVACAHCGLDVPPGLLEPGAERPFCCAGCRAAYAVIHDSGLDRYYDLEQRRGAAVTPSGKSFEEFDHPTFHELYVRRRPDGLAETELYLEGIHCASCVWLVERAPFTLAGFAGAELDAPRARVRVTWRPETLALSRVARLLDTLGYRPHPFRGVRADALRRAEDRTMVAHIGVAGALAGNVMLVALALYSGWFSGMEPGFERYFRWLSLTLTAPALLFPGRVFFRGALAALRARSLHMDVPIALALAAGFVRGAVNTVSNRGPIYFDGVAMLVFLLLVGRFLQQRAQRAAADSAELLHALRPATARLAEGDAVREVPAEALLPGMVLEVRPGDTLAADGTVLEGASDLDLSLLTGESRPVAAAPGDRVWAGTVNRTAPLRVRVDEAGEATRVGRLLAEVEAGARRRAPVVRTADRLAGAFVAVVLVLAGATWALWAGRDPSMALDHAIALLIVTCPCALALATPLAVTVAIGRAASAGMLIRGGDALEALARPGLMLLDKTGTLTEGRAALAAWEGDEDVKPLVLALERHAVHPVAEGFRAAWPDLVAPEATDVAHVAGGGVEGVVAGRRVAVGAPAFVRARLAPGCAPPPAAAGGALTPVWVAVDGALVARAGFGDAIRPGARAALDGLRARGWRLRILSGDDPAVVRATGAALGFAPEACEGGATPEDKLRAVEAHAARGTVVMVGDGVNDAAAIARATVGIGVHGGAEASLAAADVFLARPGVAELDALVRGAARTLGVIRRNIVFSLAYNVVGAALAMAGVINPLIAAVLMPVSSLTVVIASWRGRTFEGRDLR